MGEEGRGRKRGRRGGEGMNELGEGKICMIDLRVVYRLEQGGDRLLHRLGDLNYILNGSKTFYF